MLRDRRPSITPVSACGCAQLLHVALSNPILRLHPRKSTQRPIHFFQINNQLLSQGETWSIDSLHPRQDDDLDQRHISAELPQHLQCHVLTKCRSRLLTATCECVVPALGGEKRPKMAFLGLRDSTCFVATGTHYVTLQPHFLLSVPSETKSIALLN